MTNHIVEEDVQISSFFDGGELSKEHGMAPEPLKTALEMRIWTLQELSSLLALMKEGGRLKLFGWDLVELLGEQMVSKCLDEHELRCKVILKLLCSIAEEGDPRDTYITFSCLFHVFDRISIDVCTEVVHIIVFILIKMRPRDKKRSIPLYFNSLIQVLYQAIQVDEFDALERTEKILTSCIRVEERLRGHMAQIDSATFLLRLLGFLTRQSLFSNQRESNSMESSILNAFFASRRHIAILFSEDEDHSVGASVLLGMCIAEGMRSFEFDGFNGNGIALIEQCATHLQLLLTMSRRYFHQCLGILQKCILGIEPLSLHCKVEGLVGILQLMKVPMRGDIEMYRKESKYTQDIARRLFECFDRPLRKNLLCLSIGTAISLNGIDFLLDFMKNELLHAFKNPSCLEWSLDDIIACISSALSSNLSQPTELSVQAKMLNLLRFIIIADRRYNIFHFDSRSDDVIRLLKDLTYSTKETIEMLEKDSNIPISAYEQVRAAAQTNLYLISITECLFEERMN